MQYYNSQGDATHKGLYPGKMPVECVMWSLKRPLFLALDQWPGHRCRQSPSSKHVLVSSFAACCKQSRPTCLLGGHQEKEGCMKLGNPCPGCLCAPHRHQSHAPAGAAQERHPACFISLIQTRGLNTFLYIFHGKRGWVSSTLYNMILLTVFIFSESQK